MARLPNLKCPDFIASTTEASSAPCFGLAVMNKKAWAAKFKKFARLAGVNEPKKNCHGVRKARAEVAAYSECTEAQMMAMFGWRDHKMPALYIAKANRDKLAISGMEKIEAYDQMENIADLAMPTDQNRIVTFESNRRKKP